MADAWAALASSNSRSTSRPRFDSLRDHVDIKAFLERRRKNSTVVHEIKPERKKCDLSNRRESMSPEDSGTTDTGFGSRRDSSASQTFPASVRRGSDNVSSPNDEMHHASPTPPPHDYQRHRASLETAQELFPHSSHQMRHEGRCRRNHRKKRVGRERIYKMFWLTCCLMGTFIHFFLTTLSYMKYETATETVIGMPLEVKIPATAVCFPIWSMIHKDMLKNDSVCFNVTSAEEIESCEAELFDQHKTVSYVLLNLTKSPIDLIDWIEIRKPSRSLQWIKDEDLFDPSPLRRYRKNQTNVRAYYRGPDKCVSFHPIPLDPEKEPEQLLSVDRMTSARTRIMFTGGFKVSPTLTPEIIFVKLCVHEVNAYPRRAVTLPVVANLSKSLSFTVSYTKIETTYLPAPYFSKCIDYQLLPMHNYGGYRLDSKQHCTARCVRHRTKSDPIHPSIPADHLLMRDVSTLTRYELSEIKFMPSNSDSVDEAEQECAEKCSLDCLTKNFYTSLSESSISHDTNDLMTVMTRFENPETSVKFIPKLDFEAYIIYVAGVFSIWFSASVYHIFKDSVSSTFGFVMSMRQKFHDIEERKRQQSIEDQRARDQMNNCSYRRSS